MKPRWMLIVLLCALPFGLVCLSARWRAEALAPVSEQRTLSMLVALRQQLAQRALDDTVLQQALSAAAPAQTRLDLVTATGLLRVTSALAAPALPPQWRSAMARYPAGWQMHGQSETVLALPWQGTGETAEFIVLSAPVVAPQGESAGWALAALVALLAVLLELIEVRRARALWRAAGLRLQATLPDLQDDAIGHAARALQALRQRCDSIERQLNETPGSPP